MAKKKKLRRQNLIDDFWVKLRLKNRTRLITKADINSVSLVQGGISTMFDVEEWEYQYAWQNPFRPKTNCIKRPENFAKEITSPIPQQIIENLHFPGDLHRKNLGQEIGRGGRDHKLDLPRIRRPQRKKYEIHVLNVKVKAILHYIDIFRKEIELSMSSQSESIHNFDAKRWCTYFQRLIRIVNDQSCETDYDIIDRLKCENKYLRKRLKKMVEDNKNAQTI